MNPVILQPELLQLLLSVTGPVGSALVMLFFWLRGRFNAQENFQKRTGRRLYRLERHAGIPVALDDEPDTDVLGLKG